MEKGFFLEKPDGSIQSVTELPVRNVIGFSGQISNALRLNPKSKLAFYPLGKTIIVKLLDNNKGGGFPKFLTGHLYPIECLELSHSGKYLISGEGTPERSKVNVIVWDVDRKFVEIGRYKIHRSRVASVDISVDDKYAVSVGGKDDSSSIILWDILAGKCICSGKSSIGHPFVATYIKFLPNRNDIIVVSGQDAIHVWRFLESRLVCFRIAFGKVKRNVANFIVKGINNYRVLCGTDSGDIIELSLRVEDVYNVYGNFVSCNVINRRNNKDINQSKFAGGVTAILSDPDYEERIIVGSGSGVLSLILQEGLSKGVGNNKMITGPTRKVSEPTQSRLKEIRRLDLKSGRISSLVRLNNTTLLVGCANGDMYKVDILTFESSQLLSNHVSSIKSLIFPYGLDDLCCTCGDDGFRIWALETGTELLHVQSPSCTSCNAVVFSEDGSLIYSGWSDGSVRTFTPQTGKCTSLTKGVHPEGGVTALGLSKEKMITGGGSGQLKVWSISSRAKSSLICTVHRQKSEIVGLEIFKDGIGFVSASKDGTCIIWDIGSEQIIRKRVLYGSASFNGVGLHKSESQILTLSVDGQISYWDTVEGNEIRHLQIGKHGTVISMDLCGDDTFLIGYDTGVVKVWDYQSGNMVKIGGVEFCGGKINALKKSPNFKFIVAVTEDGGILIFDNKGENN